MKRKKEGEEREGEKKKSEEGRDGNEEIDRQIEREREREREVSGSRIETRSLVENVPRVGGRLRRIRRRWITR